MCKGTDIERRWFVQEMEEICVAGAQSNYC
jgi:hypothetical protein